MCKSMYSFIKLITINDYCEQESSVDKQPISSETPAAKTDHVKTGDPEKDKKIGNIRKVWM